jgi:hypothetical protein
MMSDAQVDQLQRFMIELVNGLALRIDVLDTKFTTRIDALDTKFTTRIDRLEHAMNRRFDRADQRFDELAAKKKPRRPTDRE